MGDGRLVQRHEAGGRRGQRHRAAGGGGDTGGAFAALFSAIGSFGLLLAWPALLVAGGVAVVQLSTLAGHGAGRRAARAALGHLVAGTVAWLVIWAWSAAWIADLWLALVLVGASVVPVTALSIVQGRRAGSWPTPTAKSQEPAVPEGPVRGGPLERPA